MAEDELPPAAPPVVKIADFDAVDFEAPISGILEVECHVLETAYIKAAKEHEGKDPEHAVFRLLANVCGLHFKLKDKAETYGPQIAMGGRRSSIPGDSSACYPRLLSGMGPRDCDDRNGAANS